ncbi:5-hydroxytryptamine receptor 2B [Polypterus senegalus]|uniref:5-hydroxytryptamine receptor 2B n=1 Tax=Polypterus senegalus TaxID=55291 RepID=UPI001964C7A1|nr:5-hydroxytryptamine receptor 2B [Polypterus senegalus]
MLAKRPEPAGQAKPGKLMTKDMTEHGCSSSLGEDLMQVRHIDSANASTSYNCSLQQAISRDQDKLCWAALLIIMVIIATVGGNILVILAISLERKLQNATNYFLMSLAVADLLVGVLVMPIALITVLYNTQWPLPLSLCPIWIFLDVLFSTASIMHLCAISLDRYIAIKKPIQHSQFNSRAKAICKISVVWLISIGIAIPIPIKGIQDQTNTITTNLTCILKTDRFREFIIFGSTAAFFVPLGIMMVIYLLTIQALKKKAYLLKSKTSQRCMWSTVSTVFQRELPGGSSLEKSDMLDGNKKQMAHLCTGASADGEANSIPSINTTCEEEIPIRRMSAMGKKSMQNISNEQRASKVLGIVFFLFVIMWCPFFITNMTSVLCATCNQEIISRLMEIFVWVGYVSSGINPLVYTLFNKTFREAFSRYITCNYSGTKPHRLHGKSKTRISFHCSVAENSKFLMKHSMRNGISNRTYQGPLWRKPVPIQSSATVLLDTLLLNEHDNSKHEEQVSCV